MEPSPPRTARHAARRPSGVLPALPCVPPGLTIPSAPQALLAPRIVRFILLLHSQENVPMRRLQGINTSAVALANVAANGNPRTPHPPLRRHSLALTTKRVGKSSRTRQMSMVEVGSTLDQDLNSGQPPTKHAPTRRACQGTLALPCLFIFCLQYHP